MKLIKLRKPKATGSPSYADCRPKTNAEIFWNMVLTKRRPCKGRIGKGKETKNSNE
jgi:hypothetical protein